MRSCARSCRAGASGGPPCGSAAGPLPQLAPASPLVVAPAAHHDPTRPIARSRRLRRPPSQRGGPHQRQPLQLDSLVRTRQLGSRPAGFRPPGAASRALDAPTVGSPPQAAAARDTLEHRARASAPGGQRGRASRLLARPEASGGATNADRTLAAVGLSRRTMRVRASGQTGRAGARRRCGLSSATNARGRR